MNPYTITLPDGTKATIVEKTEGRKRSPRLLFVRIRQSRTLIAYTIKTEGEHPVEYTLYKSRREGEWIKGGERNDGRFTANDEQIADTIEKAIDDHEATLGKEGWKWLF